MSKPKSWSIRKNLGALGTAHVVDEHDKEIAFCQTEADAKRIADVSEAVRKGIQLCSICWDWDLLEVEIDGEMVDVKDLGKEFETALKGAVTA